MYLELVNEFRTTRKYGNEIPDHGLRQARRKYLVRNSKSVFDFPKNCAICCWRWMGIVTYFSRWMTS